MFTSSVRVWWLIPSDNAHTHALTHTVINVMSLIYSTEFHLYMKFQTMHTKTKTLPHLDLFQGSGIQLNQELVEFADLIKFKLCMIFFFSCNAWKRRSEYAMLSVNVISIIYNYIYCFIWSFPSTSLQIDFDIKL